MKLSFKAKDRQSIDFAEQELTKSLSSQYGEVVHANNMPIGLPIGSIIVSAVPLTNAGVHLLDGSTVSANGIYSEFSEFIRSVYPNGDYTTEQYDNDISRFGQCGHFVINQDTIKLPTITEFIASSNGNGLIGLAELDSFKSHTHEYGVGTQGYAGLATIGAGNTNDLQAFNVNNKIQTQSSGSEKTQPKNIRYPYYIVLANHVKNSAGLNIDKISTDLQDKLSKTEVSRYVTEKWVASDGLSWYTKYNDGWKECGVTKIDINTDGDGRNIVLPVEFSNTNYTSVVSTSTTLSQYTKATGNMELWFFNTGIFSKTKTSVFVVSVIKHEASTFPPCCIYCCGY